MEHTFKNRQLWIILTSNISMLIYNREIYLCVWTYQSSSFWLLPHSARRKESSYRMAEEGYKIWLDQPATTTHPPTQRTMDCFEVQIAISQQPLARSYPHFKLNLRWPIQSLKHVIWRRPQQEDDLKILKVAYLSNHWAEFPQILNLSSGDQTKIKTAWYKVDLQWKTTFNGRRPQNIKNWISQQQLVKLRRPNQN